MNTVGPVVLTVGIANAVADPAERGGNPSAACQIQNSSDYQLAVIAAGDTISVQPFTAVTVPISGQPITVQPITGTGAGVCEATFVFLLTVAAGQGLELPGGVWIESPSQPDGPLITNATIVTGTVSATITGGTVNAVVSGAVSISGTPTVNIAAGQSVSVSNTVTVTPSGTINVQGVAGGTAIGIAGSVTVTSGTVTISGTPNINIASGSVGISGNVTIQQVIDTVGTQGETDYLGRLTGTGGTFIQGTFTNVPHSYSSIIIVTTPSGAEKPFCFMVQDQSLVGGSAVPAPIAPFGLQPTTTTVWQGQVATVIKTGDTVQVTCYYSAASSARVDVFGVTNGAATPMRPDLRAYPIGTRSAFGSSAGAGITTVIAAPASPLRILIKTLAYACSTNTAGTSLNATIGGTANNLAPVAVAGNVPVPIPPDGLLLDVATALTISGVAATNQVCNVVYDIVI